MSSGLLRKTAIVVIMLLACVQVIGLFYASAFCGDVEERIIKIDAHLYENSPDTLHQNIVGDYPLQLFIKDTYVNAGICKDMILLVLLLTLIMSVFLFLYFFNPKTKANKSE